MRSGRRSLMLAIIRGNAMTKNMTLFSRLTHDFDTNAPLIVLENLPFYKGATFTSDQLRRLAAKLIMVADEADKGHSGEFKNGGQLEEYYQVRDYESTLEFQDNEENFDGES
jgi:hypothetical protein